MNKTLSGAMKAVRSHLRNTKELSEAFEAAMERFAARDDIYVYATGSLASGPIDGFSDLDFELVTPSGPTKDYLEWLHEQIRGLGTLHTHFPATHLGLPNLIIYFFKADQTVVKIDVKVSGTHPVDTTARLLLRPKDEPAPSSPSPLPLDTNHDFEDDYRKFVGWMWYTFTKIQRGELLESLDSLNGMRLLALLPSILFSHNLPMEGYRRLEHRLTVDAYKELENTFPITIDPNSLIRALFSTVHLFELYQVRVVEKTGHDHRTAEFGKMQGLIAKHLANEKS